MKENENHVLDNYMKYRRDVYASIIPDHIDSSQISEANWVSRAKCFSGEDIGIFVQPGDICYMDFGQQYLNEAGYQHFGLVLSVFRKKALVIPMTSNPVTYAKAYDPVDQPKGRKNLMRIGQIHGMTKPSVLFLNDMKYVNTARVIEIMAHVPVNSPMFRMVQKRVQEVIFVSDPQKA